MSDETPHYSRAESRLQQVLADSGGAAVLSLKQPGCEPPKTAVPFQGGLFRCPVADFSSPRPYKLEQGIDAKPVHSDGSRSWIGLG